MSYCVFGYEGTKYKVPQKVAEDVDYRSMCIELPDGTVLIVVCWYTDPVLKPVITGLTTRANAGPHTVIVKAEVA